LFGALAFHWLSGSAPVKMPGRPMSDPAADGDRLHIWPEAFSRSDLAAHLQKSLNDSRNFSSRVALEKNGARFELRTTIDEDLQKYVAKMLGWSRTHQAAVVAMNPYDGRILAMASRDQQADGSNLSVRADFPAASLFKIVSASAALEAAGFTPDQSLFFNGSRYTLYWNQLKATKGRYSVRTTLRKAFAVSNNAVFGKIGMHHLGTEVLLAYADRFRFNRPIPFDMPVAASTVEVPENDFGLAEMSSGFNKKTLISPLHAALIVSAVVNNGKMATPWLVSTIADGDQQLLYRARPGTLGRPIDAKTARALKLMMQDGVRYGTTRKAFRDFKRSKKFAPMVFGSKTGTINDRRDRFKYDWIVAFALTPEPSESICVAVLAVHGKLLGTRAVEMAGAILRYHLLP
jgi:cell division protein FtsI/penicillin-binding protein 2